MPTASFDGIQTYYETHGLGTPILICAPGGIDATLLERDTVTGAEPEEVIGVEAPT